ncbi:hypothetical protein FB451DRAFT_1188790 [Mycena latifolia]|nr:hypothetical protein FB451DRAFT_1188790 [Mycena latifolia]
MQSCWWKGPNRDGVDMKLDNGVKNLVYVFHQLDTFLLVPFHVLNAKPARKECQSHHAARSGREHGSQAGYEVPQLNIDDGGLAGHITEGKGEDHEPETQTLYAILFHQVLPHSVAV